MLKFRPMLIGDMDEVYKIEEETFSRPFPRANFERDIEKNPVALYYVMEKDKLIIGYFAMWIIIDEGHIINVAIDKSQRGKGYGNLLIEKMVDLSKEKGISQLTLEVRRSNMPARHLYNKYGFKDVSVRKDYYTKPKEDAIIMWADLEVNHDIKNTSN